MASFWLSSWWWAADPRNTHSIILRSNISQVCSHTTCFLQLYIFNMSTSPNLTSLQTCPHILTRTKKSHGSSCFFLRELPRRCFGHIPVDGGKEHLWFPMEASSIQARKEVVFDCQWATVSVGWRSVSGLIYVYFIFFGPVDWIHDRFLAKIRAAFFL